MIDIKKLVDGCSHSVPIIVPCHDCVKARIDKILTQRATDITSALRDERQALEKSVLEAQVKAARAEKECEALRARLQSMQTERSKMETSVRKLEQMLTDERLRLSTEQSLRNAGLRA